MKPPVRFGVFEFASESAELWKSGIKLKLGAQPAQLLSFLIERPGQVVTREQLQKELWPSDTFVEFDAGLNTAVKKVRQALGDTAENPRFIETLPRQGYRFIAPVGRAPVLQPAGEDLKTKAPEVAEAGTRRIWPLVAAGLLVAGVAGFAGWWAGARPSASKPRVPAAHVLIELPPDQVLQPGALELALSPDGRNLVYVATRGNTSQLFLRPLNSFESHPIPGTEGALCPFFSPDGARLAFFANGELKNISLDGKESRKILTVGRDFGSLNGTWGQGETLFFGFFAPQSGAADSRAEASLPTVWQVSPQAPGPARVFPEVPDKILEGRFVQQLLPGGDGLLFSTNASPVDRSLSVYSLKSKQQHVVVHPAMGGRYLPSGHLIYFWANNLMAVPFDLHSLTATGAPVVVIAGVARNGWVGGQVAASDTGVLAYVSRPPPSRTITWVDLNGQERPVAAPPGPYELLDLSPDGKKLLVMRWESVEETWSLFALDLETGKWTHLSSGGGVRTGATWSPDSRSVVFSSDLYGGALVNLYYIVDVGRPGEPVPQRLTQSNFGQYPQSWTAKADILAFVQGVDPATKLDIWTIAPRGDREPRVFIKQPGRDFHPAFSPDGRWLAYSSDETGRTEVYVHPYPGPDLSYKVSTDGGEVPLWSPKGDAIYYRHGRAMRAVSFRDGAVPQTGRPRDLFEGNYVPAVQWTRNAAISADGKSFLLLKEENSGFDPRRIHVVLNWFEELNRLAPAGR